MQNTIFSPPTLLLHRDIQTTFPTLFRRLAPLPYERERIETTDSDFLDLDWLKLDHSSKVAIVSHGLEGSSAGVYVVGMAHQLAKNGFDVVAWNFRGCSGEPNKQPYWYHSGKSSDLAGVIEHVRLLNRYSEIYLVGFSIGGNITLKYLGEVEKSASSEIVAASVCSVPIDLEACSRELAKRRNWIYMKRFLIRLKEKIQEKKQLFPEEIDSSNLDAMRNFYDFDSRFTAPLNGFASANEYWHKSSSKYFLPAIQVPTLFISALDDPFLAPSCFPDSSLNNPHLHCSIQKKGGHVGFMMDYLLRRSWFEERTIAFFSEMSASSGAE